MGAPAPQIDVCPACGKLYPRAYVHLCAVCSRDPELRFELVRDFLREHEAASIEEVSDATGVSRGEIARLHAEGRLIDAVGFGPEPLNRCTCRAGTPRCAHCRQKLAERLEDARDQLAADVSRGLEGSGRRPGAGRGGTLGGSSTGGASTTPTGDDERVRYIRRRRRDQDA